MNDYIWMEYSTPQIFHPAITTQNSHKELDQGLENLCQEFEGSPGLQQEPIVRDFISWHREHHIRSEEEGDRTP